jgi:hypothetical protein
MKKILLLGIALTVASSAAMAQNWNYATQGQGAYAQPRQRQYQQPVQRQQAARPAQRRAVQPQQRAHAQQTRAAQPAQRATQPVQKTYQPAAKQVDNSYMAEDTYKLGNPLYVPRKGQSIIEPGFNFIYMPEDKDSGQIEGTGFQIAGGYTIGLTDKLSLNAGLGYSFTEYDDEGYKTERKEIAAKIGARYHALSMNGFDVNIGGDLEIAKEDDDDFGDARTSSVDMYVLAGTTVQNVSPYVKFGFSSSLWSETNTGTGYFFQPGVYVDINPMLGLDLNLDIQEDTHSMGYSARLDIYPAENISLGAGLQFAAPEEYIQYFLFKTSAKFAF